MCDCVDCERMMQPYLDRELTEPQRLEAEEHLDECSYCKKRYVFEESLRAYVRLAVSEPMPPELKERLAAMRTPLT